MTVRQYDREQYKPVLKCSICTGEQVAGFKDTNSGKFEEVMLIRNEKELESFKQIGRASCRERVYSYV